MYLSPSGTLHFRTRVQASTTCSVSYRFCRCSFTLSLCSVLFSCHTFERHRFAADNNTIHGNERNGERIGMSVKECESKSRHLMGYRVEGGKREKERIEQSVTLPLQDTHTLVLLLSSNQLHDFSFSLSTSSFSCSIDSLEHLTFTLFHFAVFFLPHFRSLTHSLSVTLPQSLLARVDDFNSSTPTFSISLFLSLSPHNYCSTSFQSLSFLSSFRQVPSSTTFSFSIRVCSKCFRLFLFPTKELLFSF